jgi:hypothetical protein
MYIIRVTKITAQSCSKQHVADDYAKHMSRGERQCNQVNKSGGGKLEVLLSESKKGRRGDKETLRMRRIFRILNPR